MTNGDIIHARLALLRLMEWYEDRWAADRHAEAIRRHATYNTDAAAIVWLASLAGGWWTWPDGGDAPVFVEEVSDGSASSTGNR